MTPPALPKRFVLASATLVLAFPIAAWWIIGDLSESETSDDQLVRPPDIPNAVENAIGGAAVVTYLVAATVVLMAWRTGEVHSGWWRVLAMLLAAGALMAVGGRILTARTDGANIGGGFVMFYGLPAIVALLGGAALMAWRLTRLE